MDADTSEKIRDVISFVHSRTLSIGVYSPGDISVTSMYEEAASDLAEIIQQEIAKARLNEIQSAYEQWINGRKFISSYFRDRIAELSSSEEAK